MPSAPKSSSGSQSPKSRKGIGSATFPPTYARIHAYQLGESGKTTRTVFGPYLEWIARKKAKDLVEVGGYEMAIVEREK